MANSKKYGGFRGRSFARTIAFQVIHEHETNSEIPESLDEEFIQEKFEELAEGRAAEPDEDGDLLFSPDELPKGNVSEREIEDWSDFARRLIKTTLSKQSEIDIILSKASEHWRLERMMTTDRNILRMAVAEFDLGTPAPVVINEAIELGKKFGSSDSASFINGILGGVLRERKNLSADNSADEGETES